MKKRALNNLFQELLTRKSLFSNKNILQSSYTPETIPHRDIEIKQIANILVPTLKTERPSNVFVYGKTGTGKTLTIKYITKNLLETAKQEEIPLKIIHLNCKLKRVADTEYRLIAQIAREFGKAIPPTGLPTDEVYKAFFSVLDKEKQITLLVLDEIDQLVKKTGDGILYNLTRINEELKNSQITIIGISNDIMFVENLDPRVKSSLSEEEVVFPPYNALQLQDILRQRAKMAFKKDSLGQGVIEKCSAYAAREHGDARRALELLRVAGEIAERNDEDKVSLKHIDEADKKLEHDRVIDLIRAQPKQFQTILYTLLSIKQKTRGLIFTGEVYDLYKNICFKTALSPLTQRRVSDILAEFDMLGVINTKVISKGRYGRTREISLALPSSMTPKIKQIVEEELGLS
jgi:cell division control protein 6